MKVLIVDNYDSFTYNLYHYACKCDVETDVKRNDELTTDKISEYDKIILSPGPGLPSETHLMFEIIRSFGERKPILGVCLGMQGIAEFYGGELQNQERVKHGVQVVMRTEPGAVLYKGLPPEFNVGLYHSWCVEEHSLPDVFSITGRSVENVIMSIEHKELPVYGVQFHPESVMTEHGLCIIRNFLNE